MSAVIAHLQLPAAPTRPCTLSLTLGLLSGHFTALVIVDHNVIAVAGGDAELAESISLGPVLKVGGTRFQLLPEEVEPVRVFLARFPSPAVTSHSADHEATIPADLPSDGNRGASPPADVCPAEGALECNHGLLSRALISVEDY